MPRSLQVLLDFFMPEGQPCRFGYKFLCDLTVSWRSVIVDLQVSVVLVLYNVFSSRRFLVQSYLFGSIFVFDESIDSFPGF